MRIRYQEKKHEDLVTYFDFIFLFVIPVDICIFISKDQSFLGSVKVLRYSVYQFKWVLGSLKTTYPSPVVCNIHTRSAVSHYVFINQSGNGVFKNTLDILINFL